jgi:hypothetical protein
VGPVVYHSAAAAAHAIRVHNLQPSRYPAPLQHVRPRHRSRRYEMDVENQVNAAVGVPSAMLALPGKRSAARYSLGVNPESSRNSALKCAWS